jgi:diguanylate cyclase
MATNQHERAQTLAKMAMALMAERQVAPTPENFALFYSYVAGENPAAARVLSDLIAARRPMPPHVLDDLRQRFFGTARLENEVESIGTGISETVASTLVRLEAAARDTEAYGRTLSVASGELGGAQSVDGLHKLVGGLLNATRVMETRTKTLETELQQSSREVSELRTKLDDVRKESLTDPLTGIANRKAFDLELAEAITQSRASGEPLCLLMADIDHFKTFNDTWGHQTGDQVLRLVAGCLSESVKGRDTPARYGGEEFAVVLCKTDLAGAVGLAEQIRQYVQSKKLVKKSTGDILGTISISIGAAELAPGEPPASLIQRADGCLYAAKAAGRNCVVSDANRTLGQDIVAA